MWVCSYSCCRFVNTSCHGSGHHNQMTGHTLIQVFKKIKCKWLVSGAQIMKRKWNPGTQPGVSIFTKVSDALHIINYLND